ncbi:MAG: HD domain-containing protein [Erysipelotrichaceae bacterium]|nr:HD domain-containing protein [Erysipelotrichaceae bacterium]
MEPLTYLEIIQTLAKLKDVMRHSWTSEGRQESVAEHSWRMGMMVYFLKDSFPQMNLEKALILTMIHDLGEIFTGDIPVFEKESTHEQKENDMLHEYLNSLPAPYRTELLALTAEYEAQETLEAKVVKAVDKLEVIDQHNLAPLQTWIPLEYELNLTHGQKQCAFNDMLESIRQEIVNQTKRKTGL